MARISSLAVVRPVSGETLNWLLRALPAAELHKLQPHLRWGELSVNSAVMTGDAPIDNVLFVEEGTVSMIVTLEDGARIEVGLVGPEGMVGLSLLLGCENAAVDGLVQVPGSAWMLSASAFQLALADLPSLRPLLLRYVDAFHFQVTQTAACNGRHPIEQRLARWLLMAHDRTDGDSFPITQEFLSIMLGVRRPGVTLVMGALQRAGLVSHRRGTLSVMDRQGLEAASCECYKAVQRRFAWLTHPGAV